MSALSLVLAATLSFHGLTPADSRDGLANPERGWRFESGVACLAGDPIRFDHLRDNWPFARFAQDGVRVTQAYCYLTKYVDGPIADDKIAALEADFARARREGVKFLLRFAYEFDSNLEKRTLQSPTAERILAHIEQLKPVVRRNLDVIYCMQTGWVGLWGEFHSSARGLDKDPVTVAKIVRATLDMLPPERKTMMRRIAYKETALKGMGAEGEATATNGWTQAATARIGFFNDGTLANWWDGGTFVGEPYADGGNHEFERAHREGLYAPVDGELFWSGEYSHPVFADGYRAIDRFSYHRYTTFSLVHGHSLLDKSTKPWTIDGWKKTPVTAEALTFFGIDYDPSYFEGVPYRTAYEFIRDHLGYRIALKEAVLPDDIAKGGAVRLTLRNYGFAPPVNPRRPVLVAVSGDGACAEIPVDFDLRALLPGTSGSFAAEVRPGTAGRIALWLPDAAESVRYRPEYAIRLATRMPVETLGGRLLHFLEQR